MTIKKKTGNLFGYFSHLLIFRTTLFFPAIHAIMEVMKPAKRARSTALRIFVSGPLTHGDPFHNVHAAVHVAGALVARGFVPFLPHIYPLWDMIAPRPYEDWMRLDLAWLEVCDAVLRLPGFSPGGDREVERARDLGIPVFHSVEEVEAWAKGDRVENVP